MLSLQQQGVMTIVALNHLPFLLDYLGQDVPAEGCCPNCCASCGVLRELDRAGTLSETILLAPPHVGAEDYSWWRDSAVDRIWLYAVWDCTSRPKCEDNSYPELTLDYIAESVARRLDLTVPEAYRLLEERLAYEQGLVDEEPTHPIVVAAETSGAEAVESGTRP